MKITQNQYINKSMSVNNKNSTAPWEFKSISDVSNGYIQSKNLSLFNGVSEEMDCGGNSTFEYAYFLLSNPNKSSVNIFVKNSQIYSLIRKSDRITLLTEIPLSVNLIPWLSASISPIFTYFRIVSP